MYSETKKDLRERVLTLLRNQKEEDRLVKSVAICNKLFVMKDFQKAESILFYASFNGEVDTFEMMRKVQKLGKKISLPMMGDKKEICPLLVTSLADDLEAGPYGIMQPRKDRGKSFDIEHLDMVIVPGVAFDKQNNRLGRGGGYYDRFLEKIPSAIPTVGLAFDFQIVERIPKKDHDIPVSCVLVN